MSYQKIMSWPWIAGFIEGEGYIGWTEPKDTSHKRQGSGGRIIIGQKDKRPLTAIHEFLFSAGCKTARLYLRKPANSINRGGPPTAMWILEVCRRDDVMLILSEIKELVIQKRPRVIEVMRKIRRLQKASAVDLERAIELRATGLPWWKVATEMRVHWARLKGVLEAAKISVKSETSKREISERCREKAKGNGCCINCLKPRGKKGTTTLCRRCADRRNEWKRRRLTERKGSPEINYEDVLCLEKL